MSDNHIKTDIGNDIRNSVFSKMTQVEKLAYVTAAGIRYRQLMRQEQERKQSENEADNASA